MAIKNILKDLGKIKSPPKGRGTDPNAKAYPPPDEPRTKSLPFDRDVPGDRGDYEKQSLVQGSE